MENMESVVDVSIIIPNNRQKMFLRLIKIILVCETFPSRS